MIYKCKKCGCEKGYLKSNDYHTGFYCANCNSWVAWVKKKDVNTVELKRQLVKPEELRAKEQAVQNDMMGKNTAEVLNKRFGNTPPINPYVPNNYAQEAPPFEPDLPFEPDIPFEPDAPVHSQQEPTKPVTLLAYGYVEYIKPDGTRLPIDGQNKIEIKNNVLSVYDLVTDKKIIEVKI